MFKPENPKIIFSASQFKTADLCARKWYGEKVLKLPRAQKDYFTFGTILHEVAERWLRATVKGEVPLPGPEEAMNGSTYSSGIYKGQTVGNAVLIHPPGWDKLISVRESSLIVALVDKAIEEGVLRREPGGVVEKEFWREFSDTNMWVVGYIDYSFPWEIHDHKTTSNFRYALTPAAQVEDIQMRAYAYAMISESPKDAPDFINLQHNYFLKDPSRPKIKTVRSKVAKTTVLEFWGELENKAADLLALRESATVFLEAPGPEPGSKACQKYGGCAFQDICSGLLTTDQYSTKINRILDNTTEHTPFKGHGFSGLPKEKDMGLLGDRLGKKEAEKATPKKEESDFIAPPWAAASCSACNGKGWNKKGSPCGICEQLAVKNNLPSPDMVKWGLAETEVLFVLPNGIEGTCSLPPAAEKAEVKVVEEESVNPEPVAPNQDSQSLEAEAEEPEVDAPGEPDPEPQTQGVKSPHLTPSKASAKDIEPAKKKRGRTKKTFTLAINCAPAKSVGTVKDLDRVFHSFCEQLAQQNEESNYYLMDAFERRNLLAAAAKDIAESMGTDTYLARPDTPDMHSFIQALRPFAYTIWEPIGN